MVKHVEGSRLHTVSRMKVDLDSPIKLLKMNKSYRLFKHKGVNRGERIRHKWRVRRSFIKIHLKADVRTKQIPSIKDTREDAPDEKGCSNT